jgi:glycosyltransferase involved in cell wall biosynthesis
MKILEINKFYFAKGGADKHFLDVLNLLKNHGHQVAVFSMRHPDNPKSEWDRYFLSTVGYTGEYNFWQKIKGISRMFYSFEAKKKIKGLLDNFKPDLVHIHNIYHQLSPEILFEIKKRKIPVIMTVHDYKLVSPNYNLYLNAEAYNRCKNHKYYECLADKCVKDSYLASFIAMLEAYWHGKILKTYEKNVDLYIAPSNFVKNILIERGINARKIIILPHFINKENQINNPPPAGNGASNRYGFYFGRISREKGVSDLIDVFKDIKEIKLYLAGGLESFKLPESKNIKHLGYLDQDELNHYIGNALFIISGSNLPETFGLVALEAIGKGKPFLGYKTGAFSEIIKNGENGMLVKNKKELKKIIGKIIKGELQFSENKIKEEAFKKFNSERYYQKISGVFENLKIGRKA